MATETEPKHGSITDHRIKSPACDRCTQGVVDATNDHRTGLCRCDCHPENAPTEPGAGLDVERCVICREVEQNRVHHESGLGFYHPFATPASGEAGK